jgi:glycosyltransferase involved in cell wall biosynthesis
MSPPPLRILVVTPHFLPEMGGVERHVHETSRRLADAGAQVTVLTVDPSGDLPAHEQRDGVVVGRVRGLRVGPVLYRTIVKGPWDIVHVQSYHTSVAPIAMLAALRSRIPYVLTFHSGGHSSHLRQRGRPLQRWALRPLLVRARRLIGTASFEITDYVRELRLPEELFAFIPNGMDSPADREPVAPVRGLIASVGRLERYKGHQRVISTLPLVLEHEPTARLWIAGAGPYERELRRLAHRLGVDERVEIRAVAPEHRAALLDELRRVSVVVLLSEFETHPLAALEALSAGCRVVVADGYGLGELGRQGLARVVARDAAPATVAAAIVEELRAPASVPVVSGFTWDDCAGELLRLYESVRDPTRCAS